MRIVPDSTITLYQNVDIDGGEQLVFSSKAKQTAYFQSKIKQAYTPCTMVKKTGALRVEISGAIISQCNYLSFVNPSFDNKTVYARIVDYDYVNNECVDIVYAIDYWQTWMFDVHFEDMYIEREHLSESDFQKAEVNPYDSSILEFKTSENLPISKDIEKPIYQYGSTAGVDGIYCAEAMRVELGDLYKLGALVIYSDVNLKNLDAESPDEPPTSYSPSHRFYNIYSSIEGSTGLDFYKITYNTWNYLHNSYGLNSSLGKGLEWGESVPLSTSTIKAPVNYVYIDDLSNDQYSRNLQELLNILTDSNSLSSILGIYPVSNGMISFTKSRSSETIFVKQTTAKTQNVINKKLDLYPYSYYRVIAPNGDTKELKIEDFKTAQDGLDECRLAMILDCVETPILLAAPMQYKATGTTPFAGNSDVNVSEGVIFSQFPTLPYDIDAFKAQMAVVANSIIGNNTIEYQNDLGKRQSEISDSIIANTASAGENTVSSALSIASGGKLGGGSVTQAMQAGMTAVRTAQYDVPAIENERKQSEQSYDLLSGGVDNAIYQNFKYTRPAYAANQYHQINGDGIINYNEYSMQDILFLKVTINPTILAQYDRYFTNYGYNSGRCGIPRVIKYTQGSTETEEIPHWLTLNNKQTSYVKTRDCKVTYAMLPVAQSIKSMFDSGVRMIKGDLT